MNIDPAAVAITISAFNVLATLGGGAFFMGSVVTRLKRVETDVRDTRNLVVNAAVDASRITRAEDDIRLLRRGVGFINDADAHTAAREY